MFETLFGTEMPLPVRFFIAFMIVLGLTGVTASIVRSIKPDDSGARSWRKLPLAISGCALGLSLYALWVAEHGALPAQFSNRVDPASAVTGAAADAARAVLYEEDPNDSKGRQLAGSTIWRTDVMPPGAGSPAEIAVRADVQIPGRGMSVTWTLRHDSGTDGTPAHTIEIMFKLPADFPAGGIKNVPGVWLKQAEQAQGRALAGLSAEVTNGFFLIDLSTAPADRDRNIRSLKEWPWLAIPIVYSNNLRAILAMTKGATGERAFAEAFNAWEAVPGAAK